MNFIKGVMFGTILTASTMMMYSEDIDERKKKMLKRGKQFAKSIF